MSFNLPSRRVIKTASACSSNPNSLLPALQSLRLGTSRAHPGAPSLSVNNSQRRHASGRKTDERSQIKDVTKTASLRARLMDRLTNRGTEGASMFSDEISGSTATTEPGAGGKKKAKKVPKEETYTGSWVKPSRSSVNASLLSDHYLRATDPDPRSRVRWQRKMVIRDAKTGTDPFSRESRLARIMRTERASLSRSPQLSTSVKKLVHLSHQIQGKTVDEALEQMRFSKKKMAAEVAYHIRLARDRAIAARGMGIPERSKKGGKSSAEAEGVQIVTKDGKRLTIDEPTRMYIDQSWVGRGPWRGHQREYRARGVINILHKPSTTISVLLKEEKTRIREHQEREEKKYRQGPWIHLPDRPVTAQRQYYSW